MLSRLRIASAVCAALLLVSTTHAMAKGNFTFLIVSGEDLPADVYIADPALTADFFGFADFMHARTNQPANPGTGYEITRYYLESGRREAFDHLHYFPASGYVYFDGIVNGSSEYDGKWYVARPEMRLVFEKEVTTAALAEALRRMPVIRRT